MPRLIPLSYPRRLRLLWPYLLLWALAAAIGIGYGTYEIQGARDRGLGAGRDEAANMARVLEAHVARSLEGSERTLELLKSVHESSGRGVALSRYRTALDTPNSTAVERQVSRFDRNGRLVDSTDADDRYRGLSIADRPWFQDAREQPRGMVVGPPVLGRLSGRMVIPLVRRLDAADGSFDGVLVTALDPARLVHLFRTNRVGESSSVGLADREGRVYVQSTLADPLPADTADNSIPRSAETQTGSDATVRDLAGSDRIVALAGIPGSDLVAFAAFSPQRMVADQQGYARTIVLFALLSLLVMALPIMIVARRALREVEHRNRLEAGFAMERQSARTDPLTQAANRREFDDRLARCHAHLVRSGLPFVLALIDVDHFKRLNDSSGHAVGDRALQRIASTLMHGVRETDLVARLGGDEFAVIMSGLDRTGMRRPFEAILAALHVSFLAERWPISLSIGAIAFESPTARPRDACMLTDQLMYEVKAAGRDGIRFAVFRDQRLAVEGPSETIGA